MSDTKTASLDQQLADVMAAAMGVPDHEVANAVDAVIGEPELLRAIADQQRPPAPTLDVDAALASIERDYVQALNAILAAPAGDDVDAGVEADVHRWRGHAEARRAILVHLRRLAGRPVPEYGSQAWRDANGVYTIEQVAGFSRATSR